MKNELLRKIMTRGRQLSVVLVVLVSGLAVTSCSEQGITATWYEPLNTCSGTCSQNSSFPPGASYAHHHSLRANWQH